METICYTGEVLERNCRPELKSSAVFGGRGGPPRIGTGLLGNEGDYEKSDFGRSSLVVGEEIGRRSSLRIDYGLRSKVYAGFSGLLAGIYLAIGINAQIDVGRLENLSYVVLPILGLWAAKSVVDSMLDY
ncbi:MAG: hypothetical protein V1889_01555 [archaeon]